VSRIGCFPVWAIWAGITGGRLEPKEATKSSGEIATLTAQLKALRDERDRLEDESLEYKHEYGETSKDNKRAVDKLRQDLMKLDPEKDGGRVDEILTAITLKENEINAIKLTWDEKVRAQAEISTRILAKEREITFLESARRGERLDAIESTHTIDIGRIKEIGGDMATRKQISEARAAELSHALRIATAQTIGGPPSASASSSAAAAVESPSAIAARKEMYVKILNKQPYNIPSERAKEPEFVQAAIESEEDEAEEEEEMYVVTTAPPQRKKLQQQKKKKLAISNTINPF
jgi:hypothetical protein